MFLTQSSGISVCWQVSTACDQWVQVQDVGLIFLSAMATAIAHDGLSKGVPKAEILGTTLATITVSTFIVGLLIILVGAPRPTASSCSSSQQIDRSVATGVQLADCALKLGACRAISPGLSCTVRATAGCWRVPGIRESFCGICCAHRRTAARQTP